MKEALCKQLPDLAQHIILEFLDYRLRCGKYIRQIPKDLPIYNLIRNRPQVEELYFSQHDDRVVGAYYDNINDVYYDHDEDGYETYFKISLIMKYVKRKGWLEKTLEIDYSYGDRNKYRIQNHLYDFDFDGSKHSV